MPLPLALLLAGLGTQLAGSALAGRGKSKTTGTATNQSQFDPVAQKSREAILPLILSRLNQPLSMDPALLTEGVSGINQAFNAAVPSLQSIFSSRGLGQSGLFGGSLNNAEMARMGQIAGLIRSLTGTAFDRQTQSINQALNLGVPTGETQTRTQTQSGPGAMAGLGPGLMDIATLVGILMGTGQIGRGSNSTTFPVPMQPIGLPKFPTLF